MTRRVVHERCDRRTLFTDERHCASPIAVASRQLHRPPRLVDPPGVRVDSVCGCASSVAHPPSTWPADATISAHFPRTKVMNEPSPSKLAVLRPGLLPGVGITYSGSVAAQITARLEELGATSGADVLVHGAANGGREALDEAWDAIREHKAPLIVLLAPRPGDAHHEAARAGLENLARTLSIEWARHGIRAVTILQGADPHATAELVAFLASKAGAYYAGCAFTLRPPTAPRPSPP